MNARLSSGMKLVFAGLFPLLGLFDVSHAQQPGPPHPSPAVTIARVEALIAQIERRVERQSDAKSKPNQALAIDLVGDIANWRPQAKRLTRSGAVSRSHPPVSSIQHLVSDAICRQHKASLRLVHRLDSLLGGQLFTSDEALIVNEIARRLVLGLRFQPPLVTTRSQELKDINRRRQLKRILADGGPDDALGRLWSFRRLCTAMAEN